MAFHRLHIRYLSVLVLALAVPAFAARPAGPAAQAGADALALTADGAEQRLSYRGVTFHTTANRVEQARWVDVPGSPAWVALWSEVGAARQSVPYYAISLDGREVARVKPTSYLLKLRHGDFDPAGAVPPVVPAFAAGQSVNLYIVQFVTQPLEAYRAAVEALGGTVHSYLAHHAHIVKMSPQARERVAALPFVRWVGQYHPAYRLESPLLAAVRGDAEPLQTGRYHVEVFENDGVQKPAVARAIRTMGGTVHDASPGGTLLDVTLTPEQLRSVVALDTVLFIGPWGPPVAAMNNVRIVGGGDYVESVAGYTGVGVRGEIMDNGCETDHPDYVNRLLARRGPVDIQTHGTATFGIVFGDGATSSNARGMMPDAFGIFSMWGPSNRYADTGFLIEGPYNCVFQSNSWGTTPLTREYVSQSSELDRAVYDFDVVICQAQGNYSNQDSLRQSWGKNIVCVGGIVHNNTLDKSDDGWFGQASIGPAEDGRIKPDLAFWYDNIRTTTVGGHTSGFGGTSAATPETAGHFGLFFQMWADGLFGHAVSGGTVFEERAHAATAKAVMINTASQYPFSGVGHDLTRVHQGWGHANVENLYDYRDKILIINETELVTTLQKYRYRVEMTPGEPFLRATLVYTDFWGMTSSSQHRINDLTLKVTSPSAVEYWGNNGLLEGNWSTPGGVPNSIDNVENVFVENPEVGLWTIEVFADELNEDGHPETTQFDADFSLVVTCELCRDCNNNGILDEDDIDSGTVVDCNANGIPDSCEGDYCVPTPNPMAWESPPAPVSTSEITMTAVEATDDSPPVEYFFLAWPGPGSGNDTRFYDVTRTYADAGLDTNMIYTYTTRVRDSGDPRNYTDESPPSTATTHIETPSGISFGTVTDTSIQVTAQGPFTRLTGDLWQQPPNQSGIFFEMTPADGTGANVWGQSQTITVTGLSPGTPYTFQVKARNYLGQDETPLVGPAVQNTSGAAPCPLLGDMNGDGAVRGDDVAGFVRAKLGQAPEPGDNPACANYGGLLMEDDVAAFVADLLGP